MFGTASGRMKWLPEMDGFLRSLKLPTWTGDDANTLMEKPASRNVERALWNGISQHHQRRH